jgi:hypothetical protein
MSKVYAKIAAVQAELAKTGIAKDGRNSQQGYNFRGIDQVYSALAPLLASHGLCILPRMIAREVVERQSAKGGALFNVTVEAEFDFVAAEDGSTHVVRTFGEAMDSADKATNKAMSAAYKYAALMTFAVPTEGDNDADGTTHEVAVRQPMPPVTIEGPQLDELQLLFDHLNVPVAEFLAVANIQRLSELPASWFDRAKSWVNNRALELRKEKEDA